MHELGILGRGSEGWPGAVLRRRAPHAALTTRDRSARHLARVREAGCVIQGCFRQPVQAHHEKAEMQGSMGMKPADSRALGLCAALHHPERERLGRAAFWTKYAPGFDYEAHMAMLWAETCSEEEMP